jgi:hypothetical protein
MGALADGFVCTFSMLYLGCAMLLLQAPPPLLQKRHLA